MDLDKSKPIDMATLLELNSRKINPFADEWPPWSTNPRWALEYHNMPIVNKDNWWKVIGEPDLFIHCGAGFNGWDHKEHEVVKKQFPKCEIIGFEPAPNRFNDLKGKYPGALFPLAVSDKKCKKKWTLVTGGIGNTFINACKHPHLFKPRVQSKEVEVSCVRLDDVITKPYNNICIWLDIEGHELAALKGATRLLESGAVKSLNIEVSDYFQVEGWATHEEICSFLAPYGFRKKYSWEGRNAHSWMYDIMFIKDE